MINGVKKGWLFAAALSAFCFVSATSMGTTSTNAKLAGTSGSQDSASACSIPAGETPKVSKAPGNDDLAYGNRFRHRRHGWRRA